MAVDVICPECGGVVGATGVDSQGRGPCTCFKDSPSRYAASTAANNNTGNGGNGGDPSDTVSIPSPTPSRDIIDSRQKFCIVCGRDVAGHRRVKDSRGYLCYDCAKAEIANEKAGTIPCAECGRRVKEGGIFDYNSIKICRKCFDDHKEAQKKAVRKISTEHYDAHERRGLFILLAVFVVLGLIVLWRTFLQWRS
jgi:hypothetical protein